MKSTVHNLFVSLRWAGLALSMVVGKLGTEPMRFTIAAILLFIASLVGKPAVAQDEALNFLTIERPPFAFEQDGQATGFSIELTRKIADEIGQEVSFTFVDDFAALLGGVEREQADGAVANISITSEREEVLDFSQSIFGSGLKILVSGTSNNVSIWNVIFSRDLLMLIAFGFGALFVLGLLMWVAERKHQDYFSERGAKGLFPAFWWALNLVLNGGFEVNVPRSVFGRILGVFMVVSSLFVVSIFVANITAAMTVGAISGAIDNLDDLNGRRVGTTRGSTASLFLEEQGIRHTTYSTFDALIEALEADGVEAVVFDGPILAYYLANESRIDAHLLDRVFRAEDYGIAGPRQPPP